jgi:hypothetical protein
MRVTAACLFDYHNAVAVVLQNHGDGVFENRLTRIALLVQPIAENLRTFIVGKRNHQLFIIGHRAALWIRLGVWRTIIQEAITSTIPRCDGRERVLRS